jgi:hypothetical protein
VRGVKGQERPGQGGPHEEKEERSTSKGYVRARTEDKDERARGKVALRRSQWGGRASSGQVSPRS